MAISIYASAISIYSSAWLDQLFSEGQAQTGGIVRRSIASVNRYSSEAQLSAVVQDLGFHMIKTSTQFVIYCSPAAGLQLVA
jgi:hypothetical protein